jgi:hypothetical protein
MPIIPFLLDLDVGGPAADLTAVSTVTAFAATTLKASATLASSSIVTATGSKGAVIFSRSTLTATAVVRCNSSTTLSVQSVLTATPSAILRSGSALLIGRSSIQQDIVFVTRRGVASLSGRSSVHGKATSALVYDSDGGLVFTGGSAYTNYTLFFDLEIQWQTRAIVEINKDFQWNTGQQLLRWYRVQGCCEYPTPAGSGDPNVLPSLPNPPLPGGCPIIGIQTDDSKCVGATGKQQYVQNIVARGLADVCQQLADSKMNWQICSIKEWSRPADPSLSPPSDQCNTLTEVPHCDIPKCLQFCVDTDAVVHMGMTTFAIDTIFNYTVSGGAYTGGDADTSILTGPQPTTSSFEYIPDGNIVLTGGDAVTSSSWDNDLLVTMGMYAVVERLEAVFSAGTDGPALELPNRTTGTNCGSCNSMPTVLYFHHNIAKDNILTSYMQRNGLELPNPLPMHYSSRLQSWVANFHMLGTGDDNRGSNESWRFTFEWACLGEIAGGESGSPSWKFSMLVVRKNEASGLDYDSRMMIVFPPDQVCSGIQNLGFDFSFSLNTVTEFVSNDMDIVPTLVLLTDNIGLFKSKFWTQNPKFNIRLSKSNVSTVVQRQDIYPIFPQAVVQGV